MARGSTLLRQWEMLKILQSRRFGIATDDIAARLGCNRRTVQRDLKTIADLFPVSSETRDQGRKYWKLKSGFLESGELQLSMTEMLSLVVCRQFLAPLAGTHIGNGLDTAISKIRALLSDNAVEYFEELDESFFIKSTPWHEYAGQAEIIRLLNEAIRSRTAVTLSYHSRRRKKRITTAFHPYGMIFHAASLYCVGKHVTYGECRTLKIDRVVDVVSKNQPFDKPPDFSLPRHVGDSFGVFDAAGNGTREVTARFTGWAVDEVRELKWHPTQEIAQDDGASVTVRFRLGRYEEFIRWIMGYGRLARILAPQELAGRIAREYRAAAAHYPAAAPAGI